MNTKNIIFYLSNRSVLADKFQKYAFLSYKNLSKTKHNKFLTFLNVYNIERIQSESCLYFLVFVVVLNICLIIQI